MAYPRVRGDHGAPVGLMLRFTGLPPRARGSHELALLNDRNGGPTPACAGITKRPKAGTHT